MLTSPGRSGSPAASDTEPPGNWFLLDSPRIVITTVAPLLQTQETRDTGRPAHQLSPPDGRKSRKGALFFAVRGLAPAKTTGSRPQMRDSDASAAQSLPDVPRSTGGRVYQRVGAGDRAGDRP